jgi:hypothetical protein
VCVCGKDSPGSKQGPMENFCGHITNLPTHQTRYILIAFVLISLSRRSLLHRLDCFTNSSQRLTSRILQLDWLKIQELKKH